MVLMVVMLEASMQGKHAVRQKKKHCMCLFCVAIVHCSRRARDGSIHLVSLVSSGFNQTATMHQLPSKTSSAT